MFFCETPRFGFCEKPSRCKLDLDLSKGILEAIDMDSYRVEERASMKILLPGEDAEIGPLPAEGGGQVPEPEMDLLSKIIKVRHEFSI